MSIDALLADLEGEGTVDSRGGFTLDRDKAREKMRQFQLADPRAYLLQLIRAAHALGATTIDITVDADDMHMRFDGKAFSQTDFEELYDALFGRADDPAVAARRHLALGLNAALGLDPRRIVIESGAARLQTAPGVDDDWGPLDPAIDGTRIHARDRFRFANVVRFFRNLGDNLPEVEMVRDRCGYGPARIIVNKKPVPPRRDRVQAAVRGFTEQRVGDRWVYGGMTGVGERGAVEIIAGGIAICSLEVRGASGFKAVAGSPHLRTDVSQASVVLDQALAALMSLVRATRRASLEALLDAGTGDELLEAELRAADWARLDLDFGPKLAAALRDRPFGRTLAGRPVRVRDLPSEGPVDIIRDHFPAQCDTLGVDPPAEFRALLYLPTDVEPPPALKDRLADQTDRLLAWLTTEQARQDFRRRHATPRLPGSAWRVRASLARPGWRGEIGIAEGGGRGRVDWLLDGCLLGTKTLNLQVDGVHVILQGPLEPNLRYDDVMPGEALAEAALHIGRQLHDLVGQLPDDEAGLQARRRWVHMGVSADPALLIAQRIAGGKVAHTARWIRALPTSDEPLADAALFRTVSGASMSLRELQARVDAEKRIEVVGLSVEPVATRTPVLRVDPAEREVLQRIFGSINIRSGRRTLQRARRRQRFEALPPRRPNLDFDDSAIDTHHRFEGGIIGLRRSAGRTPNGHRFPGVVQPFVQGRPVRPVELALRLPSMVAAIEVGPLALDDDCKALRDPPVDAFGRQLAAEFDRLFRPGVDEVPARRMMRALIDLLVPTAAHRDAWYALGDADAYLTLLRRGWASDPAKIAEQFDAAFTSHGPVAEEPITEAFLAPFFAATGELPERLCAAYPNLTSAPTIRQLRGGAVSLQALCATVEQDGLVLHASRASVIPDAYAGVALKTEHAQLERLTRLLGDEALQKATTWKATHALERALAAAPDDDGRGLDRARAIGVVAIAGGELGLRIPFDPNAESVVRVAHAGKIVDRLSVRSPVPLIGVVQATGEVRLTLRRGRIAVDDLTRARIVDAARRSIDAALRTAASEPLTADHRRHLLTALNRRITGRAKRRAIEKDRNLRAWASAPLFAVLGGAPVSLLDVVDHRRRRDPISVTEVADVPPPREPRHLVLHLDHLEWNLLDGLLGRATPPYAATLAERAQAEAFLDRPTEPLALPNARVVVEVAEDAIRGRLGWGTGQDSLVVLRAGRRLGITPLRLGLGPLSAIVDDPDAPHTADWTDVAETPRLRRLRRICATGIPALAERLAAEDPAAARDLTFALIRCVFPSVAWVELHRWMHTHHDAFTAQDLYGDALRASYLDTPRMLQRTLAKAPFKASALMAEVRRPAGAGVEASVRAAFGGRAPLSGDPEREPLLRLVDNLGPLAHVPLVHNAAGQQRSLAELSTGIRLDFAGDGDTTWACPAAHRPVLVALLGDRTRAASKAAADARAVADARARADEARRAAQAFAERRARELAEAERRAAERRRVDAELRAAENRAAEAARQARRAAAEAEAEAAARAAEAARAAAATPPPPAPKTPEAQLCDRVLDRLHAIQADHPRLLAETNLVRLAAVETGPLAFASDDRLTVNTTHPTAQAALTGDAIATAMVTSAVYTALNLWLDAITDAHEVRFVGLLADRPSARP